MEWTQKDIENLKVDWLAYKQKILTSKQLMDRFPGRTIDSMSRKYWKQFGRSGRFKAEKKTDFVAIDMFGN